MSTSARTVLDVIRLHYDGLTPAEKKLADNLLENYPVSGLGSITVTATMPAFPQPPSRAWCRSWVTRAIPRFQAHLHHELEATISNPIAKHDRWAAKAPTGHILNRFAEAITENLRESLSGLDTATFDGAADLLKDEKRSIYFVGGRITERWLNISSPTCR